MIQSTVLRLAFRQEDAYNPKTRTIALQGPRGTLLANYATPSIPPDATQHRFLVYFDDAYTPFKGTRVPSSTRDDVMAFCLPIEVTREQRMTVDAGFSDSAGPNKEPGTSSHDIITSGTTMLDANGMSLRERVAHIHMEGKGLIIDESGLKTIGQLRQTKVEDRGITQQSNLWSIIPKTAVTFWAADMLPNVGKLKQYASNIILIYEAVTMVTALVDLATTLFNRRD